ncbi:MAG: PAS domain-containing protein [Promethearchaeota archaeon]|nr:MAG: PAS domain-containing protein [Candidatus Lokiarchaeota archaeon]
MDDECENLETIIDTTHVLLAYMDSNFNFIRVNRAYAEADNKKPSFFPGKNHFELYPNEENKKIFHKVVETGEPFFIRGKPFEYEHSPERGRSYWDWSLVPVKNSNGITDSLVLTLRDVTEREIAKQKLKESNRRSKFYKDLLAHDMRNILFVIQASLELMEDWGEKTLSSQDVKEMIERIMKQLERAANLITNVQILSEAEKEEREIKKIQLKELFNQTLPTIQKRFSKHNIKIDTNFPKESINIQGGELLIDAFENILNNAIKHNPYDRKKIWIKVSEIERESKPFVKIEFKDNGGGIPNDDKEKIFMRGVKTSDSNGMGIGLSLVKEILEGYNGQVWVENRIKDDESKGANFVILLQKA